MLDRNAFNSALKEMEGMTSVPKIARRLEGFHNQLELLDDIHFFRNAVRTQFKGSLADLGKLLPHVKRKSSGQAAGFESPWKDDDRFTDEIPPEFESNPAVEAEVQALYDHEGDFAYKSVPRFVSWSDRRLETVFSDIEAIALCGGHADSNVRRLATRFYGGTKTEEVIFRAHSHALDLRTKYSDAELAMSLALPALPFGCNDAFRVFGILEKSNKPLEQVTLIAADGGQKKQINLRYLSKQGTKYKNIIQCSIKGEEGRKIYFTRTGKCMVRSERQSGWDGVKPKLLLFLRWVQTPGNIKQAILNFGVETGVCGICGRRLTDPDSIQRGIGPECNKRI